MTSFCQLWLTCADNAEASKITKMLLKKRLIACAKQIPVTADYWWEGKIEHGDEVLLLMESLENLFDEIETEVKKLHSYDTFVLELFPISKISKEAADWLYKEIND